MIMIYKQLHNGVAGFINYKDPVIQINSNVYIQRFARKSLLLTCNSTGESLRILLYFQNINEEQCAIQNIESVDFRNTSKHYEDVLDHGKKVNHTCTTVVIRYVSVRAAKYAFKSFSEFYGRNIYNQKNESYDIIYTTILFANSADKLNKMLNVEI